MPLLLSDKSQAQSLIADLEAVQEGNLILDQRIADHLGIPAAPYTHCIEEAMKLLPRGASLDLHVGPHQSANDATVYVPRVYLDLKGRRTEFDRFDATANRHGTIHWNRPALAICIASLRALMTLEPDQVRG
jgi:hypothetical protein